jgi:hypothetical protein
MAFPEGDTFEILPNLSKRVSPLEKHVRDRNCLFKAFWMVDLSKVQVYSSGRKIIK